MRDARWGDVIDDVRSAERHFTGAVALLEAGGFDGDTLAAYRSQMALLHAMESGYTSLEAALERLLDILGEAPPTGASYHADLIRRMRRPIEGGRPAVFDPELADAIDHARRFRHVARKSYDSFDVNLARPAVESAAIVLKRLMPAILSFRDLVDPPSTP